MSISPVDDIRNDDEAINAALPALKKKAAGSPMFKVVVPWNGSFIVRQQTLNDVREVSAILEKHEKAMHAQIAALSTDEEKNELFAAKRAEASDISNLENLRRTVLFPEDFAERCDNGTIPAGIMATLISYVMNISGWADDVVITEV